MGIGTFFTGPLSDTFGRKPVIIGGAVLYIAGAGLAWERKSLELVLAARVIQGLGAAGPRVVSLALVRDLYSGRQMARVVSFVDDGLLAGAGHRAGAWRGDHRGVRLARRSSARSSLFSLVSSGWLALRQPETHPASARRPLSRAPLAAALREVLGHKVILVSMAVLTLGFAALFSTLSSTQQIFDQTFGRGASFPLWFALIAVLAGSSSLLNAAIVVRVGMRRVITVYAGRADPDRGRHSRWSRRMACWPGRFDSWPIIAWTASVFFMNGMTFGNITALAMEPLGHIAGMPPRRSARCRRFSPSPSPSRSASPSTAPRCRSPSALRPAAGLGVVPGARCRSRKLTRRRISRRRSARLRGRPDRGRWKTRP